jgi:hypothetical protein
MDLDWKENTLKNGRKSKKNDYKKWLWKKK